MTIKLTDWMNKNPYADDPYSSSISTKKIMNSDWSKLINSLDSIYKTDLLKNDMLNAWQQEWTDEDIEEKFRGLLAKESREDKVVRILKGDFEKKFGMTFEEFIETYNKLLEENPERLI